MQESPSYQFVFVFSVYHYGATLVPLLEGDIFTAQKLSEEKE